MRDVTVRLTGKQKSVLWEHLFPSDGMEAIALLIAGRHESQDRCCLSVMEIIPVPHSKCDRRCDRITWPTRYLRTAIERAKRESLSIIKIHSHPGGFDRFSETDDISDSEFFESVANWIEEDNVNASLVALPCGRFFGRCADSAGRFWPIDMISVAGESIEYWTENISDFVPDFAERQAQVLGERTIGLLRKLRCAVVGISGLGSPTVEQLFRLGVGEILLIDPDCIGPENLNRIINSRHIHAKMKASKVSVLANAIEETDIGTTVVPIADDLCRPSVIRQIASCDIVFGCVDSVFARYLLNKLCSTYCLPFIDLGVGIKADGSGGINHVTGAVHYLQPDGSSLLSRNVFTLDEVQADALRRSDPGEYAQQRQSGYIKGADVARPAIMPVNVIFSGLGVYEFLCRLHPLRDDGNSEYAIQRWSLSNGIQASSSDGDRCLIISRNLCRGDMTPLLGMPQLSEVKGGDYAVH